MRLNKQIIIALVIMIATSALYRVMPGRPYGFAPQIAIALFGGSLFSKQKQYAFLLPILSMFISDLLYQVLFIYHLSPMEGFYSGQLLNYVLIAGTAVFGFGLQNNKVSKFVIGFLAAPTVYFLVSNFSLGARGWISPCFKYDRTHANNGRWFAILSIQCCKYFGIRWRFIWQLPFNGATI